MAGYESLMPRKLASCGGVAVTRISNPSFTTACYVSAAHLLSTTADANVHGVETLRVTAADEPPVYDLKQIEDEVTEGIRRTERNYWLRAAMLGGWARDSAGNDCGSGGSYFQVFELMCEVASGLENAVENAARRAQADQAVARLDRSSVRSDPALALELAANIDELLSSNLLQLQLAMAIRNFIRQNTDIAVVDDESDMDPGHLIATNLSRVEAIGNKLDSQVAIRLRGEAVLVSNRDGAIVDTYSYAIETPGNFIEAWSRGGLELVGKSVDDGIAAMAEVLAEEIFLIVSSPRQRGKGYLVIPTAPRYKTTLFGTPFFGLGGDYRPTDTLQPTFAWNDFRDAYAKDPLYADVGAADIEVSYDIRIYRSRPSSSGISTLLDAAELVHEFRGISTEDFTPNVTFEPCTPYVWTVRARFCGRNKTHLTHWSGAYKEKSVEELRQRRVSDKAGDRTHRSVGSFLNLDVPQMQREEAQYFPFLATSPGQKCSEKEIRAAMAR